MLNTDRRHTALRNAVDSRYCDYGLSIEEEYKMRKTIQGALVFIKCNLGRATIICTIEITTIEIDVGLEEFLCRFKVK